jgi:hypothetical protein
MRPAGLIITTTFFISLTFAWPAFVNARLNFLSCSALNGQWWFVLGRTLLSVSRPAALGIITAPAFRCMRLFGSGSRSSGACVLFVQRKYNTRFTYFSTWHLVGGKT